jgi:hypothetical protein
MKSSFIFITLLFSFYVIGDGKFRRHFIEKMCQYIVPNELKRISQLEATRPNKSFTNYSGKLPPKPKFE